MTDTADDLLRRALDALEAAGALGFGHPPIGKEIRAYLAAPEMKDELVAWMDEPVAYIDGPNQMLVWAKPFQYSGPKSIKVEPIPLYLHPPTKTAPMKPMTEEEIAIGKSESVEAYDIGFFAAGVRFAEKHHQIHGDNNENTNT